MGPETIARFRVTKGLALTLVLVVVASLPVYAGHHLPGETETKSEPAPVGTIKLKPSAHAMSAGDRIVMSAKICNAKGKKCRPAKSAKWRIKPDGLAFLSAKRGAVSVVESHGEAGILEVTVKQDGATGNATITVGDRPPVVDMALLRDDLFVYAVPESVSLAPGAEARVEAWGCPIDTASDLGANGVPDGTDDGCEQLEIRSVVVGDREPLLVQPLTGTDAVVQWWPFAAPAGEPDDGLVAVQLVTNAGVAAVDVRSGVATAS